MNDEHLQQRLTAFLEKVSVVFSGSELTFWDIGFPEGHGMPLGSKLGRKLWDSEEARSLVSELMKDDTFRKWFEGPPGVDFVEPRLRLASVAESWFRSGLTVEEWIVGNLTGIKESLWEDAPIGYGLIVCQGVTVREDIRLPFGLLVAPADRDRLELLSRNSPISRADIIRLPNLPTLYLLAACRVSRDEFPFAAISSVAFAMIGAHRLRENVWLSSGVLPTGGDGLVWHGSQFPPGLPDRVHTSLTLRLRAVPVRAPPVEVDPSILHEIVVRDSALRQADDTSNEDETWLALWMARTFINAALDASEPLMCFLMSYATLDGLFRLDGEDESRLGPRIAMLIGSSIKERRSIRRFFQHAHDLRGKAAHGTRPQGAVLGRTLGRDVPVVLTPQSWEPLRNELYQELELRSLSLLRRSLVAFYALTSRIIRLGSETDPPLVARLLTRSQVLTLLDSANANNDFANRILSESIPGYAKVDFPTPLKTPPSTPPARES